MFVLGRLSRANLPESLAAERQCKLPLVRGGDLRDGGRARVAGAVAPNPRAARKSCCVLLCEAYRAGRRIGCTFGKTKKPCAGILGINLPGRDKLFERLKEAPQLDSHNGTQRGIYADVFAVALLGASENVS